eukprot:6896721-Alexandrium_andersonii.AAC.1
MGPGSLGRDGEKGRKAQEAKGCALALPMGLRVRQRDGTSLLHLPSQKKVVVTQKADSSDTAAAL